LLESLAPTVATILAAFADCFTKPGFANFTFLVTGWVQCHARHSISRVIQAAGSSTEGKHHSTLYRFLSLGRWAADEVGHCLFRLLLKYLPQEIVAIVDDTLCIKDGPHIFGAGMHPDIARSTYASGTGVGRRVFIAFGHSWVLLAVWVPLPWNPNRGIALPVIIRLYRSKKLTPPSQYRKRTELAREAVDVLKAWLPDGRRLHVVGDGEYSCETLVKDLPEDVAFTGRMIMDAALYAPAPERSRSRGRPPKVGKRLPSPRQIVKRASTKWESTSLNLYGRDVEILVVSFTALWYSVAGTRLVRVVVTRDPKGQIEERAYFSTTTTLVAGDVLAHYARRWELEVTFRNGKQVMGIEDPQNGWWRRPSGSPRPKKRSGPNPKGRRGEKAVVHTFSLAMVVYGLVALWYFEHGDPAADVARVRREAPWYLHKVEPSFMDMLAAIRRKIWAERFSADPDLASVAEKICDRLPQAMLAS
jgi:hypothetical protein